MTENGIPFTFLLFALSYLLFFHLFHSTFSPLMVERSTSGKRIPTKANAGGLETEIRECEKTTPSDDDGVLEPKICTL